MTVSAVGAAVKCAGKRRRTALQEVFAASRAYFEALNGAGAGAVDADPATAPKASTLGRQARASRPLRRQMIGLGPLANSI